MELNHLFSEIQVGPVTLKNRIIFGPHGTGTMTSEKHLPTEQQVDYFVERAKGGAALIEVGGTEVHRTAMIFSHLNLICDEAIPWYQSMTSRVHEYGAKIVLQLGHLGREMQGHFTREPIWAPSAITSPYWKETPKEMEREDIEEYFESIRRSVEIAKQGGFDGVQVYTSQGYLMGQFLSPHTNKRTDEYGGSVENRTRLLRTVIDIVRETGGDDFLIGLKFQGDDFIDGGLTIDDTREIAQMIGDKVHYYHVTAATYAHRHLHAADMSHPLGILVPLASAIREVVDVPVFTANRVNDPVQAEKIINDGHADGVAMVRALIADPEWPNKAKEGRLDDIRTCVACNLGCHNRMMKLVSLGCIQNAAVGEEKRWGIGTLERDAVGKRVVVVGGGPGGLEAARVAALRGARVTLFEKQDCLGGQANLASIPEDRQELAGVIRFLTKQVENLKVEVRLNTEATSEMVLAEQPDAVILATGSTPLRAGYYSGRPTVEKMPGVNQNHVITTWEALTNPPQNTNIVIIDDQPDGDFHGPVTAEFLADNENEVTIVTRALSVGQGIYFGSLPPLLQRLHIKGVNMVPMNYAVEIEESSLKLMNVFSGEESFIEDVDYVVLAMGSKANEGLYKDLKGKVGQLYRAGDCAAPRAIINAVYEAHKAARSFS